MEDLVSMTPPPIEVVVAAAGAVLAAEVAGDLECFSPSDLYLDPWEKVEMR